jgi:hypothetical protein
MKTENDFHGGHEGYSSNQSSPQDVRKNSLKRLDDNDNPAEEDVEDDDEDEEEDDDDDYRGNGAGYPYSNDYISPRGSPCVEDLSGHRAEDLSCSTRQSPVTDG